MDKHPHQCVIFLLPPFLYLSIHLHYSDPDSVPFRPGSLLICSRRSIIKVIIFIFPFIFAKFHLAKSVSKTQTKRTQWYQTDIIRCITIGGDGCNLSYIFAERISCSKSQTGFFIPEELSESKSVNEELRNPALYILSSRTIETKYFHDQIFAHLVRCIKV